MDRVRAYLVDAFTDVPYAGNPAGVVPSADDLADDQLQAIAAEIGASETAFLRPGADADRRVRYFTPTTEIDLCGHATIGSLVHLAESGAFPPGEYTLETNVGVLDVSTRADGTAWMTQSDPVVERVDLSVDRVATALGIDPEAIGALVDDLPFAVASTGLPFLVVPVDFLSALGAAEPDADAVVALGEEVGAEGVYAFTFDTLAADATVHGRAFVPAAGIPEDPVTGTASGATASYLREVGAFNGGGSAPGTSEVAVEEGVPGELIFEQGHFVDRPGRVRVRVGESVRVGGSAVAVLDGEMVVPTPTDDDILEV